MKAIHLTAYGNPVENLKLTELPEPKAPAAGEALVEWNITDCLQRSSPAAGAFGSGSSVALGFRLDCRRL